LNPPAIVGEAVAGTEASRSSQVMRELEQRCKGIETYTFDVADLLAEVRSQKYYETWNYESFGQYVSAVLGMKERQAQYLVRIVQVSEVLGLPRSRYEHLGITKVREIFSLDPKGFFVNQELAQNEPMHDHILRLLEEAPQMSVAEVKEEVKRLKGLDGENSLVWCRVQMGKQAKAEVFDRALELCKMKLGSAGRDDEGKGIEYSDGSALEAICQDFLSDPNNAPEDQEEERLPE
jgi:hypothetical protein